MSDGINETLNDDVKFVHTTAVSRESRVRDSLFALTTFSQGGYVLIRRGDRASGKSSLMGATLKTEKEWRINFRYAHKEYTSTGLELEGALDRATIKLMTLMRDRIDPDNKRPIE